MRQCKVAIIGAGTAGLSARKEVAKETDRYVVIDPGPLGTTCARVGCMPSKVLIQVANDYHRRLVLEQEGIHGSDRICLNSEHVMRHVRELRDRFVRSVFANMNEWADGHLLEGAAHFVGPTSLDVAGEIVNAERVIIASGSSPIVPKQWEKYRKYLIDTDHFFELEDLPESIAVVGLGAIGIELGQAMARLGCHVQSFTMDKAIGGLTDSVVQEYALMLFRSEFDITLQGADRLEERDGRITVCSADHHVDVNRILLSMGRRPNLSSLRLDNAGVELNEDGKPSFDTQTMRIRGSSIYFCGDVNGERPVLHEASDQGRVAGYNAVRNNEEFFKQRVYLGITFTDPNIAVVGESHEKLNEKGIDFVIGRASFEGQGRAIVSLAEKGLLHIYVAPNDGAILGAEMIAPQGEHLAHLIAWAIASKMDITMLLSMPFYHPVLEEGLRSAARDAAKKLTVKPKALDLIRCEEPAAGCHA